MTAVTTITGPADLRPANRLNGRDPLIPDQPLVTNREQDLAAIARQTAQTEPVPLAPEEGRSELNPPLLPPEEARPIADYIALALSHPDAEPPVDDEVHDDEPAILPPPSNPMAVARKIVEHRFTSGSTMVLRAWRGGFYAWDGRCWPERDEVEVRAETYRFLEHATYLKASGPADWEPNRNKVANVHEALRAVTHLSETIQPPAWIDHDGPDPRDLLVVENGILHVPTRELAAHDPRLFASHAVPFPYDPEAAVPTRWLDFLRELWEDDDESIASLQEVFGYALSGDTSLQKIFMLVGPTRAGKGVISNVLSALLGRHNVGAPTLAGIVTNFGLQDLIGKSLAVIADARLGADANVAALAERMLSISGEDAITIDRKYRNPWTGRLGVRFLLMTNELPRLTDTSTALAKRFVVLVLQKTFYDKEDPALLSKLLPELPGILNWSLDGLDRLRGQGYFTRPAASRDAIQDMEDLGSPMGAFLRDRCVVKRDQQVGVDDLWTAWKSWSDDQSRHYGNKQTFGRDLRAAIPGLKIQRPRDDGARHRVYLGVGLSNENNGEDRGPSGPEHEQRGPEPDPGPSGPHGPRSTPLKPVFGEPS
jgi:putative DNA primase/helicase